MHDQAKHFTLYALKYFPEFFTESIVLDVGAGDINGNNRFLFDETCSYNANDVTSAPNVTIVAKTKDLSFPQGHFHMIISTECFEHDPEYAQSFLKIYEMLEPGGLFVFTCATTGRPEHGTRRTTPEDSYGTKSEMIDMQDYYKNLTIDDVDEVLHLHKSFQWWSAYANKITHDLYFIGLKKPCVLPPTVKVMYTSSGVRCLAV